MTETMNAALNGLLNYAEKKGMIEAADRIYCRNRLLQILRRDEPREGDFASGEPLEALLNTLCDDAVERGVIDDGVVSRDLFDSLLMDAVTPYPHEVREKFRALYEQSPRAATDWFYAFSQDTNYIRRDRIARDRKWVYDSA